MRPERYFPKFLMMWGMSFCVLALLSSLRPFSKDKVIIFLRAPAHPPARLSVLPSSLPSVLASSSPFFLPFLRNRGLTPFALAPSLPRSVRGAQAIFFREMRCGASPTAFLVAEMITDLGRMLVPCILMSVLMANGRTSASWALWFCAHLGVAWMTTGMGYCWSFIVPAQNLVVVACIVQVMTPCVLAQPGRAWWLGVWRIRFLL